MTNQIFKLYLFPGEQIIGFTEVFENQIKCRNMFKPQSKSDIILLKLGDALSTSITPAKYPHAKNYNKGSLKKTYLVLKYILAARGLKKYNC